MRTFKLTVALAFIYAAQISAIAVFVLWAMSAFEPSYVQLMEGLNQ